MASTTVTPAGNPGDWAPLARPPRSQQRSPGLPPGRASGARRGAGPGGERGRAGDRSSGGVRHRPRPHGARARARGAGPARPTPASQLLLAAPRRELTSQPRSGCAAPGPTDRRTLRAAHHVTPGTRPAYSPAPHTHAPSPPPSDAAPQLPRPRPLPTRSPWRRLGRATPTALTRGNRPAPGSGARSPHSPIATVITRSPGLDPIRHLLVMPPMCASKPPASLHPAANAPV